MCCSTTNCGTMARNNVHGGFTGVCVPSFRDDFRSVKRIKFCEQRRIFSVKITNYPIRPSLGNTACALGRRAMQQVDISDIDVLFCYSSSFPAFGDLLTEFSYTLGHKLRPGAQVCV